MRVCKSNTSGTIIWRKSLHLPRDLSLILRTMWLWKPFKFLFSLLLLGCSESIYRLLYLLCNNCMNSVKLLYILFWIREIAVWQTTLNVKFSDSDWLCCMANLTYFSKYWIKDSTISPPYPRLLWQLVKFNWRILKECFYINVKEGIKRLLIIRTE